MSDEGWNKECREAEKTKKKTVAMIEQNQIEDSPKDETEVQREAQDLEPSEFVEESEDHMSPLEKAGSEEISDELIDPRFSKSHEFPEETLVKGKKSSATPKNAELDKPCDETPNTEA
jgi:hypothetical protein